MNPKRFILALAAGWAALGSVGSAEVVTNTPAMPDAASSAVPGAQLPYAPRRTPKFWSVATAETIMARWPDYTKAYFNAWTYVNGYAFCAFERLGRDTGDPRYLDYIKRYVDEFVDEEGNFRSLTNRKGQSRPISFNNLDNMMTGNSLVMLYEHTGAERYRKAAEKIRRAFDDYPRNRDGGFWHAKSLPGQMWIDGIFMGQMFLTRYGKSIGDTQFCWDEATKQMTVYAKRAERDHTGLYLHGVYEPGHGEKVCRWADPRTGLSPEIWSEGLGWYALITAETLADLPQSHPRRPEIEDIFHRLAVGLKRNQDSKTGRWFQVVDKGDRRDNWTDTSGSAMFIYTLAKGIEIGLLDKEQYAPVVASGYKGITASARINDRGLVDIYTACDGLGVQTNYDSYIHYKQSLNAKEAVVGFLWATEIVERARLKRLN